MKVPLSETQLAWRRQKQRLLAQQKEKDLIAEFNSDPEFQKAKQENIKRVANLDKNEKALKRKIIRHQKLLVEKEKELNALMTQEQVMIFDRKRLRKKIEETQQQVENLKQVLSTLRGKEE